MNKLRTEIRAFREPWLLDRIAVMIAKVGDGQVALAEPIVFKVLSEDELPCKHEPSLHLSPEEAQFFMDELWRAGIRPTEGAGSVGQMAATEKHLEDLRRLVFRNLQPQQYFE